MSEMLRISTWGLERIARAVGGVLSAEGLSVEARDAIRVSCVSSDTRAIGQGALFVALSGANFDAHNFLEQAFSGGAVAALVARGRAVESVARLERAGFAMIVVDDPEAALGALGHALWEEATAGGLHTIAVTGSNGKTTTKEILARLWSSVGKVHATRGNLNNQIGLPLTLCALPLACDYLIVEMGANAAGDIAQLIGFAPAAVRVVTSIGHAHIEGFGSLDGVRRAKSEIFLKADATTTGVVPYAEKSHVMVEGFPGKVLSFGVETGADVRCSVQEVLPGGEQIVKVQVDSREWSVRLPLAGAHQASNLAAASATLVAAGGVSLLEQVFDRKDLFDGFELPGGRWRRKQVGPLVVIDDAYNANPSSVRASFDAFMGMESVGARVAVLGEMRELGQDAERLHEEVARYVASAAGLDGLIAVGSFAAGMCTAAGQAARESGNPGLETFAAAGTQEAAQWLEAYGAAHGPALVFMKGSRGSRLEQILEILEKHRTG